MKKILAKIAGIITIFAMSFSPVLATNGNNGNNGGGNDNNILVCHATSSDNHPYNLVPVDQNGWDNGHSNHNGDFIIEEDQDSDQDIDDFDCALAADDQDEDDECDDEESDCDEESEETDQPGACDEMWAKFDITNFYNDVNGGNVTSDSYVGSDSNVVSDGEWFQLHNGTNYIIDPVIEGYEDVPGLAVQRMNGKIRVVLHGSFPPVSIYDPLYKEYISGTIELWNANATNVYPDLSGNNKLEDGTAGSVLDVIGISGGDVDFTIQVDNRGDDGFYADYVFAQDEDCEQESVCEYNGNLLVNGGFEAPVAPAGGWDEYDSGTPGLGWNVAWNGVFAGAPAIAKLELHRGVNGWVSEDGAQHAELDADWGYNNNEQASVKISQTVTTVNGGDYALSYAFSPRPGTGASENVLQVYINGNLVNTHGPVAGVGNTFWTTYTVPFEGTGSDIIEFRDAGTPNTLGTLLDDVKVNCVDENNEPEVCTQQAPLYARVKINTNDATKWRNWNGGNLNAGTPFFVGGNNPLSNELNGNVYDANEWFPLTNPDGSFIVDADIAGYSNVPGVAVERQNGAIRVVLYGNHSDASGGKELAAGSIELSTNASARLLGAWDKPNGFYDPISNDPYTGTRLHDVTVNDAANPMDSRGTFNGYINQYNPRFDNVGVNSDLFQFHLVATSGTDGFFARYNFDDLIEVPCGEVNPQ